MNCTYQLERGTKGLTYCSFGYDVHLDAQFRHWKWFLGDYKETDYN